MQFSQSVEHDFLKKFRKSSKNWHWPVVTKKCWIICLEKRNYFSDFERFGKHNGRQRKVDYRDKGLNNILKRRMNQLNGFIIMSRNLVSANDLTIRKKSSAVIYAIGGKARKTSVRHYHQLILLLWAMSCGWPVRTLSRIRLITNCVRN